MNLRKTGNTVVLGENNRHITDHKDHEIHYIHYKRFTIWKPYILAIYIFHFHGNSDPSTIESNKYDQPIISDTLNALQMVQYFEILHVNNPFHIHMSGKLP